MTMNRLALIVAAGTLLCGIPGNTRGGGRFDTPLAKDQ